MSGSIQEELLRYARLIEAAIPATVADVHNGAPEGTDVVRVDRGACFAAFLRDPADAAAQELASRVISIPDEGRLGAVVVIDSAGHHRPVYRPLLVYACLQAFRLAYEVLPREAFGKWEEGLRTWCDLLEGELGEVDWPADGMPARRGAAAAEAVWTALALHVAGKVFIRDAWTDLASASFGRIVQTQAEPGHFLHPTPSDNPETWWYHELCLLHAAASYAVQVEDRPLAAAVKRATAYHMAETQPDHATSQPWGVFAFAWNADTRPLADQLLHATEARPDRTPDGVSSILLADALYCLKLFQ